MLSRAKEATIGLLPKLHIHAYTQKKKHTSPFKQMGKTIENFTQQNLKKYMLQVTGH